MTKNMGKLDRIIRIILSLVLIYVGFIDEQFMHDSLSRNIIGAFGLINLIAASIQVCPLYNFTGINTRKDKDS